MVKATLQFDLPEDEREHRYALAGRDALIALAEIDQWARGVLKHGDPAPEVAEALEHLREHLIPREMIELLA